MSSNSSDRFLLTIDPPCDSDDLELEELTQRLMAELEPISGLEVTRVRSGPAPLGSKPGAEAFSLGQLALTVLGSGGALAGAVGLIRVWLTQQNANSIELRCGDESIKIKGKWTEDQHRMIDEWIKRTEHTRNAAPKKEKKAGPSGEKTIHPLVKNKNEGELKKRGGKKSSSAE